MIAPSNTRSMAPMIFKTRGGVSVDSSVGLIKIEKAIVHTIPKLSRSSQGPDPLILRNSICNLEPPAQAELESRLRLVLKESGRQIVEDIEAPSKTPAIIRGYLEDSTADFVSMSRVAQVLRDSQSGANSAGILLVAGLRHWKLTVSPAGEN